MRDVENHYRRDAENGIWTRPELETFSYNDGAEEGLLALLRQARDKSLFSPELAAFQKDWPTTYHLSRYRANLLRPFEKNLLRGKTVLELGCGCGAISRYLGECGCLVRAVEGSPKRAAIAAARCADLPNVEVFADRIQDIPDEFGKFDVVTLIGVLEYSRRYGISELELLRKARSFLKDDGCLILAIENKLGMKYFAGVPEDHLGLPWAGVVNGYRANGVNTYSRKELLKLLSGADFNFCEQFIPLPDYKLPRTVLSQACLEEADIDLAAILAQTPRAFESRGLFNMDGAWESVVNAGLLPELADSLCLLAYPEKPPAPAWEGGTLASHFGHQAHSPRQFAKILNMVKEGGEIVVRRQKLFPNIAETGGKLVQNLEEEPFIKGRRVVDEIRRCICRPGWTMEELAAAFRPWANFLLRAQTSKGMLPGEYIDLVPANMIIEEGGKARPFDLEWLLDEDVSLAYVAARGIYSTLQSMGPASAPARGVGLSFRGIFIKLCYLLSLKLSEDEIAEWWNGGKSLNRLLGMPFASYEDVRKGYLSLAPSSLESINETLRACESMGMRPADLPSWLVESGKTISELKARIAALEKGRGGKEAN